VERIRDFDIEITFPPGSTHPALSKRLAVSNTAIQDRKIGKRYAKANQKSPSSQTRKNGKEGYCQRGSQQAYKDSVDDEGNDATPKRTDGTAVRHSFLKHRLGVDSEGRRWNTQ